MDWGLFVQQILELVLKALLPVVVGMVAVWVKALRDEALGKLKEKDRWMVEEAVRVAVTAAEQSGLAGHIRNEANAKKKYALGVAEAYLGRFGLGSVDLDVLADMIESEVWEQFKSNGTPVTILPIE